MLAYLSGEVDFSRSCDVCESCLFHYIGCPNVCKERSNHEKTKLTIADLTAYNVRYTGKLSFTSLLTAGVHDPIQL